MHFLPFLLQKACCICYGTHGGIHEHMLQCVQVNTCAQACVLASIVADWNKSHNACYGYRCQQLHCGVPSWMPQWIHRHLLWYVIKAYIPACALAYFDTKIIHSFLYKQVIYLVAREHYKYKTPIFKVIMCRMFSHIILDVIGCKY